MKVSCIILTKNSADWIGLSLKSALEHFDEVIIADDDSRDGTYEVVIKIIEGLKEPNKVKKVYSTFDNFGKQKQAAHDICTGDYVFHLDSDECLGDNARKEIDAAIKGAEDNDAQVINCLYTHFVNDFCHVDNSEPIHFGMARLHKRYPDTRLDLAKNHTLPQNPLFKKTMICGIMIYHFGYMRGITANLTRYLRNANHTEMHSDPYLTHWWQWHSMGLYPTKPFNPNDLPKVAKEYFLLDMDIEKARSLEHPLFVAGVLKSMRD